jgi:hypothetical protein
VAVVGAHVTTNQRFEIAVYSDGFDRVTRKQVMLNEYAAETRDPDARSRSVKQLIVMSLSVA